MADLCRNSRTETFVLVDVISSRISYTNPMRLWRITDIFTNGCTCLYPHLRDYTPAPAQCLFYQFFLFLMEIWASSMFTHPPPKHLSTSPNFKFIKIPLYRMSIHSQNEIRGVIKGWPFTAQWCHSVNKWGGGITVLRLFNAEGSL